MRHICISKLTSFASHNGLSPSWCQAIIWTNAGVLLIGSLGTNFSEILIEIHTRKCIWKYHLNWKMAVILSWPQCVKLHTLTVWAQLCAYHFYVGYWMLSGDGSAGLILGLHPANERWRHFVTTSLIGWVEAKNQPCECDVLHIWMETVLLTVDLFSQAPSNLLISLTCYMRSRLSHIIPGCHIMPTDCTMGAIITI